MTGNIFQSGDMDRKMREDHVSQQSIPRHIGSDVGHMQGRIDRGSNEVSDSGMGNYGNEGTGVYGEGELPGTNDAQGNGEYGSATVVRLGDTQSLEPELDPTVPKKVRTAQQILADMKNRSQQQYRPQ